MERRAGGRDLDRKQVRETAEECDEARRKKTVNEAFLKTQMDYLPPPPIKIFGEPNGLTRKTESNLEEFVSERRGTVESRIPTKHL